MSLIAFLGCDGSGKSAVISGVSTAFREAGCPVTLGHWRPIAFQAGASESAAAFADNPHGQKRRGRFSSVLKLGWLWVHWWVGWMRHLKAQSEAGVVLFDRYHADLLVDPKRYRYGGPMFLARMASRMMPQPDLVVFLDADPDVLLQRKQEVSREALVESRAAYLSLVKIHPRFRVVNANQPLASVIAEVVELAENCRSLAK